MISTTYPSGEIAAAVENFPIAPRLLAELGEQLHQADVDLDRVTVILRRDASLVRSLIATANSEVYRRDEPVGTIEAAIAHFGERDTFRIAALLAFDQLNREKLPLYGTTPEQLRANALYTAFIAEGLAGAADIDPQAAFLAALFRGVGKLVLNRIALQTAVVSGYVDNDQALGDWELENVGYSNPDVAASVLDAWHLGAGVVDAVRDHYSPVSASSHLLNLAAGAAHARDIGFHGEDEYWKFSSTSYAATNTDVAMITAAAEKARRWFEHFTSAVPFAPAPVTAAK